MTIASGPIRSTAATSWPIRPRTAQMPRPSRERDPLAAWAWNERCTSELPSTASSTFPSTAASLPYPADSGPTAGEKTGGGGCAPGETMAGVPDDSSLRPDATQALTALLTQRILVLDGAMGTMIQRHTLQRGRVPRRALRRLAERPQGQQRPAHLTQPDAISGIHRAYLEAGADLVETNTFNAQRISLADYGMQDLAYELNLRGGPAGPGRVRRGHRDGPEPAALRRRRARPDQPHRVDLARRQRPGRAQRHLRANSSRPTSSRPTGWSTAAPTC